MLYKPTSLIMLYLLRLIGRQANTFYENRTLGEEVQTKLCVLNIGAYLMDDVIEDS